MQGKMAVVGPAETGTVFKAAGVETFPVTDEKSARETLRKVAREFPIVFLAEEYARFLKTADLSRDEFYIPSVVSDALACGRATVRVYENADKWYGITYREDLAEVKAALKELIDAGAYEGI